MATKYVMDTHLHSKASDGMWRPSQVVSEAKSRGLETIALTDHDTTYGLEEAMTAGRELGVKVIPGIEIDAVYAGQGAKVKDLELLGLGINPEALRSFVQERNNARIGSLEEYVNRFNSYVLAGDFSQRNESAKYPLENVHRVIVEDVIKWKNARDKYDNPSPTITKWDFVYFLLEKFAASTSEDILKGKTGDRAASTRFKESYNFLFDIDDEDGKVKPTFYRAIEAVKKSGGKAVLAHPGLSRGYKHGMSKEWELPEEQWFADDAKGLTPYKFVKDLVEHGLDGVETYYYQGSDPLHKDAQDRINTYFQGMAKKLGIMTTYGSDCHADNKGILMGLFGSEKKFEI